MGLRGPKPGSGGRPRKANPKDNGNGYVRQTVGPPSKGVRKYKHRVVAGAKPGQTVDHKNARRSDNSRGNLELVSRAENTARRNRRAAKGR